MDTPHRRPGRPRVDDPGVKVTTFLRSTDFDQLARLALKHGVSMSSLVRDRLHRRLRDADEHPNK